ncbi:unnamed protein product, partial [Amoebophrya sp. A120]
RVESNEFDSERSSPSTPRRRSSGARNREEQEAPPTSRSLAMALEAQLQDGNVENAADAERSGADHVDRGREELQREGRSAALSRVGTEDNVDVAGRRPGVATSPQYSSPEDTSFGFAIPPSHPLAEIGTLARTAGEGPPQDEDVSRIVPSTPAHVEDLQPQQHLLNAPLRYENRGADMEQPATPQFDAAPATAALRGGTSRESRSSFI